MSAIKVFRQFLERDPITGSIDASKIHSQDAYQEWLLSRNTNTNNNSDTTIRQHTHQDARKFHRALSNHVCGVDGRVPFDPEEEAAILLVLRKKARWPCFPPEYRMGQSGFRSVGFHEKKLGAKSRYHTTTTTLTTTHTDGVFLSSCKDTELDKFAVHDMPFLDTILHFITHSSWAAAVKKSSTFGLLEQRWQDICDLGRMAAFSRFPQMMVDVPSGYAQELCNMMVSEGKFVLVYDPRIPSLERWLVAQDAKWSVQYFGYRVGHFNGMLIQLSDARRFIFQVARAMRNAGHAFGLPHLLMNCVKGRTMYMDATLQVDPVSFYVIFSGRPCM